MSEPIANAMAASDSKSKKKKKSKKKGVNGQPALDESSVSTPPQELEQGQVETIAAPIEPSDDSEPEDIETRHPTTSTDTSVDDEATAALTNGVQKTSLLDDPTVRFDQLIKDRDTLRSEVTQLRESLEELQSKHTTEIEHVRTQLHDTQGEKDHAEEQYQNLLGKVNTIRSQLGERLKADAEELAQARTRIEELEEEKSTLQEQHTLHAGELEELNSKLQEQSKDMSGLRNRANLSQQNWVREKEELVESEAYMRDEFENAKQAMHDWEVLATEERSIRKDLNEQVIDLQEQLANAKESYQNVKQDRDTQSSAVDGLQKNLQEIQNLRRTELKEIVENSQAELGALRKQLEEVQATADASTTKLEDATKELERLTPFEKEVREKQLLIGKLKHETVILNDHLTKALRFLKKGKAEDNVDRHIVTSYFTQFLALDRSDPKKFQVLQLIAALLGWSEEQQEKAGLARPGAGTGHVPNLSFGSIRGSLTSPMVHRTPSTPALSREYFPDASSPASKETLAELWQNFLEQEANSSSSSATKGGKARTASQSTTSTAHP